jgi:sugar/nucleoside kinase (ribokinase family)
MTLAEQALSRSTGFVYASPAFSVDAVDNTGAGDVFRAGFTAR